MKTTVNTNNKLKKCNVNGQKCTKIVVNNVQVWSGLEYLYNAGDQATDFTGGWVKHTTLMPNSSNLTNWPYGPKGSVTVNSSNIVVSFGGEYGGVMVTTSTPIDFKNEGITSITFEGSTTIGGWGYDDYKYDNALTYATWVFALVPSLSNGQGYTKSYIHDYGRGYIRGNSSSTKTESFTKTLTGLDQLNGSYYVVLGLYRSVSGKFDITLKSITCE